MDFLNAFPAGVRLAGDKLNDYIDQFKKILSPKTEAYKGLGGFKGNGLYISDIRMGLGGILEYHCILYQSYLPL